MPVVLLVVFVLLVVGGVVGALDGDGETGIPEGNVACPYERTQDCGPATGDPVLDNDDSNENGTPDAYEPEAHQDSDGDGMIDLYDDAPYGEDGYFEPESSSLYGECPPGDYRCDPSAPMPDETYEDDHSYGLE
jgi:hypothetical protein